MLIHYLQLHRANLEKAIVAAKGSVELAKSDTTEMPPEYKAKVVAAHEEMLRALEARLESPEVDLFGPINTKGPKSLVLVRIEVGKCLWVQGLE